MSQIEVYNYLKSHKGKKYFTRDLAKEMGVLNKNKIFRNVSSLINNKYICSSYEFDPLTNRKIVCVWY